MKEKIPAPCEWFDPETDYARKDAPCEWFGCTYHDKELTHEDVKYDPQGPCKRKNMAYADTRTIDMFELDGETHDELGWR